MIRIWPLAGDLGEWTRECPGYAGIFLNPGNWSVPVGIRVQGHGVVGGGRTYGPGPPWPPKINSGPRAISAPIRLWTGRGSSGAGVSRRSSTAASSWSVVSLLVSTGIPYSPIKTNSAVGLVAPVISPACGYVLLGSLQHAGQLGSGTVILAALQPVDKLVHWCLLSAVARSPPL